MRNKFFKKACLLLSAMLCLATFVFAGCNIDDVEGGEFLTEKIDPTKTQLYIGVYNGGVGLSWINKLDEMYEAANPGVQVIIDPEKDRYESSTLAGNIASSRDDIYFLDVFDLGTYVTGGLVADITDVVTCDLKDFGESGVTIESKLDNSLKDYYVWRDGKYYALPWYEADRTMIYDVDLFEEKLLYFKEGGGFIKSLSDQRTVGPDGVPGTEDDGLPNTYSEFFALLNQMRNKSVTPFVWTGQYKSAYLDDFCTSAWAFYDSQDFMSNYTFSGESNVIESFKDTISGVGQFKMSDYTTKKISVTDANYVELQKQPGKYYSLKLMSDILSNSQNYDPLSVSPALSHLGAQEQFLYSRYKGEPIGMIIEGSWWYNEASGIMDEMSEFYGDEWKATNRRFGIMPFPVPDDYEGQRQNTYSPANLCAAIINAKSSQMDLAKDFLKFAHTNEALAIANLYSGVPRPYSYTLTNEQRSSLSYYYQQVYDRKQTGTALNRLITDNRYKVYTYSVSTTLWNTNISHRTVGSPVVEFFDYKTSAKAYFDGLYAAHENAFPFLNK